MRVLVCGGRSFANQYEIWRALWDLDKVSKIETIIHGGAQGVDSFAGNWARVEGRNVERYPALWSKHGRQAGWIRNKKMVNEGKPDLVLVFNGDRGTKMMQRIAMAAGVPVKEV